MGERGIVMDPGVCGEPCIAGTRITVANVLGCLLGSYERVRMVYPRLSDAQIDDAIQYAKRRCRRHRAAPHAAARAAPHAAARAAPHAARVSALIGASESGGDTLGSLPCATCGGDHYTKRHDDVVGGGLASAGLSESGEGE